VSQAIFWRPSQSLRIVSFWQSRKAKKSTCLGANNKLYFDRSLGRWVSSEEDSTSSALQVTPCPPNLTDHLLLTPRTTPEDHQFIPRTSGKILNYRCIDVSSSYQLDSKSKEVSTPPRSCYLGGTSPLLSPEPSCDAKALHIFQPHFSSSQLHATTPSLSCHSVSLFDYTPSGEPVFMPPALVFKAERTGLKHPSLFSHGLDTSGTATQFTAGYFISLQLLML
jgi:hypothetical protein